MSKKLAGNNNLVKVKVEKEHIVSGQRCDRNKCPVALAIRDSIPSLGEVRVYPFWSWVIEFKKGSMRQKLVSLHPPYWLSERIHDYDRSGKMKPFSFWIDLHRNMILPDYGAE